MRSLENKPNVTAPNADFPFGRIKDKVGSNPGTPVNEVVYGDIHQFFEKLMNESGITANELPESEYTGFQLMTALVTMFGKLRRKVYEIGAWNMDSSASVTVSTDAVFSKVRGISFVILKDDNSNSYPNGQTLTGLTPAIECTAVGINISDELSVLMARTSGGTFDSTEFNDTGVNRGYIIVEFEVDDY